MSENWEAVREAILVGMREVGINRGQLAKKAKVSPQTLRTLLNYPGTRESYPRTLQSISEAIEQEPGYLANVLNGHAGQESAGDASTQKALLSRIEHLVQLIENVQVVLEQRIGVVDVIYRNSSEFSINIEIKRKLGNSG